MIAVPDCTSLAPAEQYALRVLVDLARVVPVDDPAADVVQLRILEEQGSAPSLRAQTERDWGIAPGDGTIHLSRGALLGLARVIIGTRELESGVRDRFGRVPASENALVAEQLEREPIVSRAARTLRDAVHVAAGARPVRFVAPWPNGRRWAAALTHDLDVVALWPAFAAMRVAELLRKRDMPRATRVVRAALGAVGRSPVWDGVRCLLRTERDRSVVSTWFVLCGTPTLRTVRAGDLTYRPESRAARRILSAVADGGHELALHGSFETMDAPERFADQRARLSALAAAQVRGVRQHFLRIQPGVSEPVMAAAGFAYDSTRGFADRNGFRSGVADVFPVWHEAASAPLAFSEAPFCWMDRALSKYRAAEEPAAWIADALELARACREVEGLWVGIWHPNLTPALGFPGAPEAWAQLVDAIVAEQPFVGTLSRIVAWRAARRSVRIRTVAANGHVDAYATTPVDAELVLEDGEGVSRERVSQGKLQ